MSDSQVCAECEKPIEACTFKDGTSWSVDVLIRNGIQKFSKALCIGCYRAANKKHRQERARLGERKKSPVEILTELFDLISTVEVMERSRGELHTVEILEGIRARVRELRDHALKSVIPPVPSTVSLPLYGVEENGNV